MANLLIIVAALLGVAIGLLKIRSDRRRERERALLRSSTLFIYNCQYCGAFYRSSSARDVVLFEKVHLDEHSAEVVPPPIDDQVALERWLRDG